MINVKFETEGHNSQYTMHECKSTKMEIALLLYQIELFKKYLMDNSHEENMIEIKEKKKK